VRVAQGGESYPCQKRIAPGRREKTTCSCWSFIKLNDVLRETGRGRLHGVKPRELWLADAYEALLNYREKRRKHQRIKRRRKIPDAPLLAGPLSGMVLPVIRTIFRETEKKRSEHPSTSAINTGLGTQAKPEEENTRDKKEQKLINALLTRRIIREIGRNNPN